MISKSKDKNNNLIELILKAVDTDTRLMVHQSKE